MTREELFERWTEFCKSPRIGAMSVQGVAACFLLMVLTEKLDAIHEELQSMDESLRTMERQAKGLSMYD